MNEIILFFSSGVLNASWWLVVLYALVMTHITIASVTIFLHRNQTHHALDLHPFASHFFRFWLWLTTGMYTKTWVAVHRKHHAKCETVDDPHSPRILGIKKVLWQGAELYRVAGKDAKMLERYGKGTPSDFLERNIYGKHERIGILSMLAINIILFGAIGITVWAIQMAWIPFFAAGGINGIGHYWGKRNFDTPDDSTNIVKWGILVGGEELHNNHHRYVKSAKFSVKPGEFDIGWWYILILDTLGLARVKYVYDKTVL